MYISLKACFCAVMINNGHTTVFYCHDKALVVFNPAVVFDVKRQIMHYFWTSVLGVHIWKYKRP